MKKTSLTECVEKVFEKTQQFALAVSADRLRSRLRQEKNMPCYQKAKLGYGCPAYDQIKLIYR